MNTDLLVKIGLNEKEALVYLTLLEIGISSAGVIISKTKLKRGNLYDILYRLISRGVVEKVEKKKVASFRATPPENLLKIIESKEQEIEESKKFFENSLSSLKSLYNLTTEKPTVFYYEGISGLKKIYEDINREKKDIMLIRSIYDDNHKEIDDLVLNQINKQAKAGIHTRAITPLVKDTPQTVLEKDEERLVERRIIAKEKLILPGQIIIYGDKVAITDLKDSFISTLIENKNIAETFGTIFRYIWDQAEEESDEIYKTINSNNRKL